MFICVPNIPNVVYNHSRKGGVIMPYIAMTTAATSAENKKRLIESFTKSASGILGIPEEGFYVTITELPAENWGVGGKTLAELHAKKEN